MSDPLSKTYAGNHALREKGNDCLGMCSMKVRAYHVGLPAVHVHTAVNAPPEVILRLALPREHRDPCTEGHRSAASSCRACPTPTPLSGRATDTLLRGQPLRKGRRQNSASEVKPLVHAAAHDKRRCPRPQGRGEPRLVTVWLGYNIAYTLRVSSPL